MAALFRRPEEAARKDERKRAAFSDLTNVAKDAAKSSKGTKKELEEVRVPEFCGQSLVDWTATLPAIDRPDAHNPQSAAEYAADIFRYLREREAVARTADYMPNQEDITEKMRMTLVDWLVEVAWKFKLSPDTLFLTVSLLDRYLAEKSVARNKLQLVGVTCMLLASKHEEIYPPEIKDFVYVTDKAYTKDEILDMEVSALNVFGFQLSSPSPLGFLHRFVKLQECTPEHIALCQYLLELSLLQYRSIKYVPSHLAAAALFLANKIMKISPAWSPKLQEEASYIESQIKGCAKEMCTHLQGAEKATLQAVRKKFSQSQFHRVAKMVA
jgi:cyclin B